MPPEVDDNATPQTPQEPSTPEAIRDPQAVLNTIAALREEVKQLKARSGGEQVKVPPEIETELEALRKFQQEKLQEEKDRKSKELEARGQYEALLRDQQTESSKKLNAVEQQLKHLQDELNKRDTAAKESAAMLQQYRLKSAARDAFYAQGGRRGDETQGGDFFFELLWGNALSSNIAEKDNKIEILDGDALMLDPESKQPVDLSGLIKIRKSAYGFAFEAEPDSSGSGKAPNSNSGATPTPKQKLTMPRELMNDRSKMIAWARNNGISDLTKITTGIQTGEITIE